MNNNFEYYRAHRINDDSIPLLIQDVDCPDYLFSKQAVENPELMLFKLRKPVPRKPKMADYLISPNTIISKKIFHVLNPMDIEGIQLLPARILGQNEEVFDNYWVIHIYNSIPCIDAALSDCKMDGISLGYVKKLVLDKAILEKTPLDKRFIFRLKEDRAFQLFHVSIVEKIMAINPVGIRFTNIEKWHEGSYFED